MIGVIERDSMNIVHDPSMREKSITLSRRNDRGLKIAHAALIPLRVAANTEREAQPNPMTATVLVYGQSLETSIRVSVMKS